MRKAMFLLFIPLGMIFSSCGAVMDGLAQAYGYGGYGTGSAYSAASTQQGQFYYPVPQYNLTQPKFNFNNMNNSSGNVSYSGAVNSGSTSSSSSSSGSSSKPQYTKTCGVCHGTGTCNICAGDGWVIVLGMGKDHYCTSCRNHDGKCSACNGRE